MKQAESPMCTNNRVTLNFALHVHSHSYIARMTSFLLQRLCKVNIGLKYEDTVGSFACSPRALSVLQAMESWVEPGNEAR